MDINIDQAICTAHDCASLVQDLGVAHMWIKDLDKEFSVRVSRKENEHLFFQYLTQDEEGYALRRTALEAETRAVIGMVQSYQRERDKLSGQTSGVAKLKEVDWEIVQHLEARAIVSSCESRVKDMKELRAGVPLVPRAPFKLPR